MTRTVRAVRPIRDALRGAAAAIATGVLVAGVPVGLWRLVGWPLPDTIPAWDRLIAALGDSYIPDDILVKALAIVCWLAWTQIVVALAVETAAVVAGRPTPRLPLARPAQVLAARLITAIALLGTLTATRTTAADAPLTSTVVVETAPAALAHDANLDEPASPHVRTGESDGTVQASSPTYTVQRRDDLWSIAERHLDDPYRWSEIWRLNRHRTMADGRTFTDPDCIHPGWVLDLPRDATNLPTRADEQAPAAPRSDQRDGEAGTPAPHPPDAPAPHTPSPSDNGAGPSANATPTPNEQKARPSPSATPTETPASAPTPHPTTAEPQNSPPAASGSPPRTPNGDAGDHPADVDGLLRLPSGSVIGATLAAGIAAAVTIARLRRRRRYLPTTPTPGIEHDDPHTDPTIRRVHRHHHTRDSDVDGDDDGQQLTNRPSSPPGITASPLTPVTIGGHEGRPATVDLVSVGGLAVAGPTAAGTVRALLVDFLATAPGRRRILCDRPTAERLLPDVPDIPGVEISPDLAASLTTIEVEIVARARLLDRLDLPDYTTLLADHPDDPTPAVLLITSGPDPDLQPRIDALVGLDRRLGIGALVHHPPANTGTAARVTTNAEHTAADATGIDLPAGSALCALTVDDAQRFLAVLTAARTSDATADGPRRPHDDSEPADPPAAAPPGPGPAGQTTPPPPEDGRAATSDHTEPRDADDAFPATPPAPDRPVSVRLLGPPSITVNDKPIRTGLRRKARELLAALLVHPDRLTVDAAVDILWPDADPTRGVERFRTVLGNLRSTIRDAADLHDQPIIDRVDDRYHADPAVFACDLWRFQTALTVAARAGDDATAIAALQHAVDAYGGDLLDGSYYEWADAAREDLRRRAVDAAARLAELHEHRGDLDAALAALDAAIGHDPYTEELYRRIMRVQAALGRTDAVRRTYRLLETRLADLDVDPDDTTATLLQDLLAAEPVAVTGEQRSAVGVTRSRRA